MDEEIRTFDELGIPFPLFAASAKFATGYVGEITCDLCHKEGLGFALWIGDYVMVDCPQCGATNGLRADAAKPQPCYECGTELAALPSLGRKPKACHDCLRSGRISFTQDTDFGMVGWRQVIAGVTHGIPGEIQTDFETVPLEDDWTGVRVPVEWMTELTRTPTYSTIQGEKWQFCCQRPMIYIGEWNEADFNAHAPNGDGKAFFYHILIDADMGLSEEGLWEDMWSGNIHEDFGVYVFHCPVCNSYRAHWDML